jgi:catechol 2,3-dioxygenase-like lactoylglutathione lyase family enzyme
MKLIHVALFCSSEENGDRFYRDLLGLEKQDLKTVQAALMNRIFGIDREFRIINYVGENLHFEIFLDGDRSENLPRIDHVCLAVENLQEFVNRCTRMNFPVLEIRREGKAPLVFVRDFDGNLFEVK